MEKISIKPISTSKSEGDWRVRFLIWQGLSVLFGLAVVWQTLRLEWTEWQMVLVFLMAKELMTGAIGLITPSIRSWAERVIWRKNRGFSAFLCSLHIHPWLIPVLFPSLHDFTFALWMHGMVVFSAIVLHRFPMAYRGQCAAFLAGLTALLATSNGVPEGFIWMVYLYPAKLILCWWLPLSGSTVNTIQD